MKLPFKLGDKVIELGGGTQPLFRPNADVRWLSNVDIACDFNWPLPIPSCSYDGVYSRFVLEHISWRKVRQFISEIHRILTPGGIAFVITANLLEQARKIVEAKVWNDDLPCTIFGDNDYPENTHRSGFSPEYAARLFREAGFYKVEVSPLPECSTDMVIVGRKSGAIIR